MATAPKDTTPERHEGSSLEHEIANASPEKLVSLLYKRAIKDIEGARELYPIQEHQGEAIKLAIHAHSIIRELHLSLDYTGAKDFATNLSRIYEYLAYNLTQITACQEPNPLEKLGETSTLLRELSEAWDAMQKDHSAAHSGDFRGSLAG